MVGLTIAEHVLWIAHEMRNILRQLPLLAS